MTYDPRVITTAWAAEGAREALEAFPAPPAPKPAGPRLRTGRRTQQAIAALRILRNEIALGIPHAALLERIDDELFKLKKGPTK